MIVTPMLGGNSNAISKHDRKFVLDMRGCFRRRYLVKMGLRSEELLDEFGLKARRPIQRELSYGGRRNGSVGASELRTLFPFCDPE